MNPFKLPYSVKPAKINQIFGINAEYYKKFLDSNGHPFKGHMGIDFAAPHGQPVYAPCNGLASYRFDTNGGEGIYLRTNNSFDYNGGQAFFRVILWHLCGKNDSRFPLKIPTDGKEYQVWTGQLLGYADNTGYPYESSGDHLHFGLVPLNQYFAKIAPSNGFNGCIDPAPFFTGVYAQDTVSSFHHVFQQDLYFGLENDEVRNLQLALQLLNFFPENQAITGFYGDITMASVKRMQKEYGIVTFGTPNTTGFGRVGKRSLALLNQLFA